jgi:hypothetical protein
VALVIDPYYGMSLCASQPKNKERTVVNILDGVLFPHKEE